MMGQKAEQTQPIVSALRIGASQVHRSRLAKAPRSLESQPGTGEGPITTRLQWGRHLQGSWAPATPNTRARAERWKAGPQGGTSAAWACPNPHSQPHFFIRLSHRNPPTLNDPAHRGLSVGGTADNRHPLFCSLTLQRDRVVIVTLLASTKVSVCARFLPSLTPGLVMPPSFAHPTRSRTIPLRGWCGKFVLSLRTGSSAHGLGMTSHRPRDKYSHIVCSEHRIPPLSSLDDDSPPVPLTNVFTPV